MHINKTLLKFLVAPWIIVSLISVGVLFVIGCGGDVTIDLYLLNKLELFVMIAIIFDIVSLIGYICFPYIAGLACVLLAKHWKKLHKLASISAGLQYDVLSKGGYYKLYKRGVTTYNKLNRGGSYARTKSKTV